MNRYYDKDADLSIIKSKKVAIIGYGSQGSAHANNLKDSGVDVCVGLRPGSANTSKVEAAGLAVKSIEDATAWADMVMILAPDEFQGQIYAEQIEPNLKKVLHLLLPMVLTFLYGQIKPKAD
jgi:ketol-acid reductoisomerase